MRTGRYEAWFIGLAMLPTVALSQVKPPTATNALIRFPTSCGDQFVFGARGGLWRVAEGGGAASVLVAGPGTIQAVRCSPDGRWVAYTRSLGTARDVYVVSVLGGAPRRLTFRPDINNWVVGWTSDSRSIVFLDAHEDWSGRKLKPYAVPIGGGLPIALPLDRSGDLALAPDGRRAVYTRYLTDYVAWKRYQGGQAPDLFLNDLQSHAQERLTSWKGADTAPMWVGDTIYFLSDRDTHRHANIWAIDVGTRATRQVTFFADYDVDTPSYASGRITFSQAGKLWSLDVPSERLQAVTVSVPDDGARTAARTAFVKDQLREEDTDYDTDYALSPDGRSAALAARGEIFTVPLMGAAAANVTNSSGAEEDHPAMSPDGKWLAYTTDRTGEQQLALRPSAGGRERLLTRFRTGFLFMPVWSPDGRWIAIHDAAHRLWLVPTNGGLARQVAYNRDHYMHETDEHDAAFSPDGRWLAYSLSRPNRLRSLHLFDLAKGIDTEVSSPMESDYRPAFSGDGRFLYFVSDRREIPVYADRETNAVTIKSGGIYVTALAPSDAPPIAPGANGPMSVSRPAIAANATAVDLRGIMGRAVPLPIEPARITSLQARGDQLFYRTEPPPVIEGTLPGETSAVHRFDVASGSDAIIARNASSVVVAGDGSRLLLVRNGQWRSIDAHGGNERVLDVEHLHASIVPRDEWREMFLNSWRLERDLYVDADMHGVDWAGVRDHYARLLPLVGSRSDLNWLIGQMIGELAGSHLRVGGGDENAAVPSTTAVLLGADYALDPGSGRYRFARIFHGDNSRPAYRSPLTWPGVDVGEGDYLVAVNGEELRAPRTPDETLARTTGPVTLTIAPSPLGTRRNVQVLPVASEESLRELAHLEEKRALVTRLSDGRLAYIGMTDMVGLGMRQFVRQFYPQLGAEGLIIDDRGNPGGNIDEMLLERLRRTVSSMQTGRDRVPQTQPDQVLLGPKSMLIDGDSSSDGEVFPLHFRDYGLGELIGSRTWGGVRGIRTYWRLLDGGTITAPEISFYDKQGKWVVENHGVEPDIYVDTHPADVLAGRDRPLEVAVARLMGQIGPAGRKLIRPPIGQPYYPADGEVPPTYLPPSRTAPPPSPFR